MANAQWNNQRFFRRPYEQSPEEVFNDMYGLTLIMSDGRTLKPHDMGYELIRFRDEGVSFDWINEELDDLDGTIDLGDSLSPRTLGLTFIFSAHDKKDWAIKKQRFRRVFSSRSLFTVQLPKFEQGRQIHARTVGSIQFSDPVGGYLTEATISLKSPSPYWMSIKRAFLPFTMGNSPVIDSTNLNEAQDYKTTENTMTVFNKGDATIDPRSVHTPMIVRIGSFRVTEPVTIMNKTNSTFVVIQPSESPQFWSIVLDGVKVYNGSASNSLFGYSSRTILTLDVGKNILEFKGVPDGVTKEIDTKYFYI